MQSDNKKKDKEIKDIEFNGAAVIDANGKEVAITEEMIQSAFDKLAKISMLPSKFR